MIPWYDIKVVLAEDGTPISGEIVFSHVDTDDTVRHFAIERIGRDIANGKLTTELVEFPLDPQFAYFAMAHRGVERHRLLRITPSDLAHYPLVFADFPGSKKDSGEKLLIDGHHRYVAAVALGWTTLRAHVLAPAAWEPYLIDIPPELLSDKDQVSRLRNQHIDPIDSRIK